MKNIFVGVEADLAWKLTLQASGGSDTPSRYTLDAAFMLDASTRVAAAARSGLIDLHVAFVVDHADGTHTSTSSC